MAKNEHKEAAAQVFDKQALKASNRYKELVDVIEAILDSEKQYTLAEVDAAIEEFLNKEVR